MNMELPKNYDNCICIASLKALSQSDSYNNHTCITSLKAILEQEIQFEDDSDEKYLYDLSIEALNTKVQTYNKLFKENKINPYNAFQIHLISCVLQILKFKRTDILEIIHTFDAISKVYSCRVDSFWIEGSKLIKEFLTETKNIITYNITNNEIQGLPIRKKLMLTTAEDLNHKENQITNTKYLSVDLDNIIDFVNPSRILTNKFSSVTFWPEYNLSNKICVNTNKQIEYGFKNIYYLIEKSKICPTYHEFVSQYDKNTENKLLNKFNNVALHFNQETSMLKKLSIPNYEKLDKPINFNTNEQYERSNIYNSSYEENESLSSCQHKLNFISQLLPLVNMHYSDYSFFDPNLILDIDKCANHWKYKYKIMTRKKKHMSCKLIYYNNDNQKHMRTYIPITQYNSSKNNQFKVNFNLNMSNVLKNLKKQTGQHQCNHNLWKLHNNTISSSVEIPIRRLNICKYITMVPNWYQNDFSKLKCIHNSNSMYLTSLQQISEHSKAFSKQECLDNVFTTETMENSCNNHNDTIRTTDYFSEESSSEKYNEEFEFSIGDSQYIDMDNLKKYIMNIIKSDNHKILNIKFKDLILQLFDLLSEDMKNKLSVAIIYVALLHLSNELNLHLENNNNEIIISQG